MAGVTPKQIYQALLSAGASTTQAIGIMANSINESSLDPEAINRSDPNGGSYGFIQQNGSQYASLVTGNAAQDLAAQIRVLAQHGGFSAASGSTGAQAAGNFAANYERCVGCQAGGAQYNQRVANAATVEGWLSSGSWPTSAGSAGSGGGGGGGTSATLTSAAPDPGCALSIGGQHVGLLFGHGPTLPSACLIRKSEIRGLIGALVLGVSVSVGLVGAVILAASAFQRTGALGKAADAAAVVPGAGGVAAGLSAAHSRATRTGSQAASQRTAARQAAQRQQQAAQRKAAQTPSGRHAKTGPNAPATGKRNKPGP